jgi:hypothetical protein
MTEDFLHYVWKFQKLSTTILHSTTNEFINVERVGVHNFNSGPDFFNAQLLINNQLWAGNVEIHIKSSDWYAHRHENDKAYDNVILHVVWEFDAEVFRKDNTTIPTLELKSIIDSKLLENYRKLLNRKEQWIPCEKDFAKVNDFVFNNWLERLYVERLKHKSILIEEELKKSNNHWERVLFKLLCKNFGLKVNGESFYSIANSFDYDLLLKINDVITFEALLFGQAGLLDLDIENAYLKKMKEKYDFLKHKHQLDNNQVIKSKYFRLRPPNFPTLRLSQFATLYTEKPSLFSKIIEIKSIEDYYDLFAVSASSYWDSHFNFGVSSFKRKKNLTKAFIDLLLINTIIPVLFSYGKYTGKDNSEELLKLAASISSEKNNIIKKFNELRPSSKNGLHSQALLQLKNEYCNQKKCLKCVIGNSILNH